jgi:protein-tyrosine phosphatase
MGLFDFFKRKDKVEPVNFGQLEVDIHSHFIPGIDDGAKDMENSMELIQAMADFGYKKIITTPHIMSDYFRNNAEIILKGRDAVREEIIKRNIPIELDAAAEYYLDSEFMDMVERKDILTFGGNYVLFELSYLNPPDALMEAIFKMQTNGYKPVLAHPERYPYWVRNLEKYEEIKSKGVHLQLNINSISGFYGPESKYIAEWLINNHMISFLGSDCHHPGHINLFKRSAREPALRKLIESGFLLNKGLLL